MDIIYNYIWINFNIPEIYMEILHVKIYMYTNINKHIYAYTYMLAQALMQDWM